MEYVKTLGSARKIAAVSPNAPPSCVPLDPCVHPQHLPQEHGVVGVEPFLASPVERLQGHVSLDELRLDTTE